MTEHTASFFALRTPLLPFDELITWGDGLEAASIFETAGAAGSETLGPSLQSDRERLRERLRVALARPEMREALFVASPDLTEVLDLWMSDPESERGRRAEPALVRYFERSAGRATPFGLCAGCSVGTVGDRTHLVIEARSEYLRRSRLDMDYLVALSQALAGDPALRGALLFRPNSSLYEAGGRIRYVESRFQKGTRSHHLVSVESTEALEATLNRARHGATASDLAAALIADEVTLAEAEAYVKDVIDSQILVADLTPPVTGPDPIVAMRASLDGRGPWPPVDASRSGAVASCLAEVEHRLAAMDQQGLGADAAAYRAIATLLRELPGEVKLSRLFQVDLLKPARATLGRDVLSEITRAVNFLPRLPATFDRELERFREMFQSRYERREVPLVEALDEEAGIGFGVGDAGDPAPLLRDLDRPALADQAVPWGKRETHLLGKLSDALVAGAQEIVLDRKDLEELVDRERPPLPDAFAAEAMVAASSPDAMARGDFQVLLQSAGGPSGARLLGRFCHADPDLGRLVEGHLRSEEALDPEAIYAEVVHLPEGRLGNVLLRPVMRGYEIPFLGRSGAPEERQIPMTDLLVSVAGDEIVLRSARLGRRVVPRLTSAHNFSWRCVPIYRFLCALQSQGRAPAVAWRWGPLDTAPFLPRVRAGKVVLSLARWNVSERETKRLRTGDAAARFREVQAWRAERRLPRWVVLADGDNTLPIDFDNVLSIEAFLDLLGDQKEIVLRELFPAPDRLCARGPEGRFLHELVIPFVKAERAERPVHALARDRRLATASADPASTRRTFTPGSDWLMAKVYAGAATVDHLLREVVPPLVNHVVGPNAADCWFFVRYTDPDHHLRLRFHGRSKALHARVLPALEQAMQPLVEDGRIWRIQIDTYEREIERYGGPRGMELAERIFHADSQAVLEILECVDTGDAGEEERWRLALCGVDRLLGDFGFDLDAKQPIARAWRDHYGTTRRIDKALRLQLAEKYRRVARELAPLVFETTASDHPLAPGLEILTERSERLAPLVREVQSLDRAGRLSVPLPALLESFVHMHVNRLLRSAHREQELVLYDFLNRLYASSAKRADINRQLATRGEDHEGEAEQEVHREGQGPRYAEEPGGRDVELEEEVAAGDSGPAPSLH